MTCNLKLLMIYFLYEINNFNMTLNFTCLMIIVFHLFVNDILEMMFYIMENCCYCAELLELIRFISYLTFEQSSFC